MNKGTLALGAVLLLAGCTPLPQAWSPADPAAPEAEAVLLLVDRLVDASEAELARMPASEPPSPGQSRQALRHALWLATPGHAGHDPERAASLLHERLDDPGTGPALRALVQLQLRYLEQQRTGARVERRLRRENARLREQIRALTALERRMGEDEEQRPAGGPPETSE
mgnify:CR=1 FL=1